MTDGVDPKHERAVEEFIEGARQDDPAYVAEVETRYPVLTETELNWRRSREVRLTDAFANTLSLSSDLFGRRIHAPTQLRRSFMRRIIALAAVALFVLAGCSIPGQKAKADGAPRCADIVAHAMSTAAPQPVAGAYECLAPQVQAEAQLVGIVDDASWAQYAAQPPVYVAYRYVGHSPASVKPAYYYFALTPQRCYRVSLNAEGLVDGGSFGREGAACPSPLP